MSRTIDPAVITELAKDSFQMSSLVFITGGINIGFTDAAYDITWGIYTFSSNGHLLDMSEVKETSDLRVNNLTIKLSSVDQAYLSIFLSSDYMDSPILYWTALIDSNGAIIGDPIHKFTGTVVGFKVEEKGSTSNISVECASHWANFDVVSGNRTNDTAQQAEFSGDLGMEYASHSTRDIQWGRN